MHTPRLHRKFLVGQSFVGFFALCDMAAVSLVAFAAEGLFLSQQAQEELILGGGKMEKFRKGQSTLEYVIILAAVVGAIIAIAAALKKSMSDNGNGAYDKLTDKMDVKITGVRFP